MNTRRTTLIVAAVLAIGTGFLTLNYLSGLQRQANGDSAPRTILVAAQDIPARVPITAAMITRATRPASAVEPDALSDPAQVVNSLSLITIPAGSTVTQSKIGNPTDVGLPVRLKPGMRAVSVQIDKVKGISGLVEPGDRVDILADPPKSGAIPPPASTILRGVRVLAIGDTLEYSSATPSPQEQNSTTVTLEVTPKQADLLVMADINSTLRLALRSPKEPLNSLPTEALHWAANGGGSGVVDGPSSVNAAANSPIEAMAMAMKAMSAPHTAVSAPQAADPIDSPVEVIDGDRYQGAGGAANPQSASLP